MGGCGGGLMESLGERSHWRRCQLHSALGGKAEPTASCHHSEREGPTPGKERGQGVGGSNRAKDALYGFGTMVQF